MISCVGHDAFGSFLKTVAQGIGIDVQGLQTTEEACTTLAFVSLDDQGERSFSFCRKQGADQMIRKERIDWEMLRQCVVLYFGSLSLSADPSRESTLLAAKYAKEHGSLISFDPNYRAQI